MKTITKYLKPNDPVYNEWVAGTEKANRKETDIMPDLEISGCDLKRPAECGHRVSFLCHPEKHSEPILKALIGKKISDCPYRYKARVVREEGLVKEIIDSLYLRSLWLTFMSEICNESESQIEIEVNHGPELKCLIEELIKAQIKPPIITTP